MEYFEVKESADHTGESQLVSNFCVYLEYASLKQVLLCESNNTIGSLFIKDSAAGIWANEHLSVQQ